MNPARSGRRVPALIVAAGCLLASCGGGGDSVSWSGTMVSNTTFGRRGSFQFSGTSQGTSISGTIRMTMPGLAEASVPVSGTIRHESSPPDPYDVVELQGGSLSMFCTTYEGWTGDVQLVGSYTDGADSGSWHNLAKGVAEAPLGRFFPLAGMTVSDLGFAGSTLLAVATPPGGAKALYTINVDSGEFLLVPGAPAAAGGVAHDGSVSWLAAGGQVASYDDAWQPTGVAWKTTTGSQFAVHGGKGWFTPFLSGNVTGIDLATGASEDSGIETMRATGIDFVGDNLWTTYMAAGGEWGLLREHDAAGVGTYRFYTPENTTVSDGALAANGDYLWIASGKGLYELKVR